MNPSEKRRHPRTRHDSVLELFDTSGHFITGVGRLVDFSKVGVCFRSTKILAPGELLRARIRLLHEGIIETSAHIVWVKKKSNAHLYGLEFDAIELFPK